MEAQPGVLDMTAMYSEDLPLNISNKDLQQTLDILVPQVVEEIFEVIKVVPRAWQPCWRLRSQARTVARM